eukprot:8995446-Alexandrium_andersonii.AAC.1
MEGGFGLISAVGALDDSYHPCTKVKTAYAVQERLHDHGVWTALVVVILFLWSGRSAGAVRRACG